MEHCKAEKMSATTKNKKENSVSASHAKCLLCGNRNPYSLHLNFVKTEVDGEVQAFFQPQSMMQGYPEILHGGVVAALLDAAMTNCLFQQGIKALTGELQVRFLKPLDCNTRLQIKAQLKESYDPLFLLQSQIIVNGQIYAKAKAKFLRCKRDLI